MRKWVLVIVVLALLGIATALRLFFSEPRNGSVQYHKEQYLIGSGAMDKWIQNNAPGIVTAFWMNRRVERSQFHYDALMKSGYFEEREFTLSNRSPKAVLYPQRELHRYLTNVNYRLTIILSAGSNTVTIRAPREDMDELEKAVRKFDVPEK
jgi:hypothetical protein